MCNCRELQNLIIEPGSADKSDPNNSSRPVPTYNGSTLSLDKQDKSCVKSGGFGTIALNILKEMTDLSLLKESVPFLLVTLSNFFIFLGYFAPFLYITEFCKKNEIDNYAYLYSIIGKLRVLLTAPCGHLSSWLLFSPAQVSSTFRSACCTV